MRKSEEVGVWRWFFGLSAVVGLAVLTIVVYAFGPTDEQLINQSLDKAVKSSGDGAPWGVLDQLRGEFAFNGEMIRSRAEVVKFIRDTKPKITLGQRRLVIRGESATITVPASVVFEGGATVEMPDVKIELVRDGGFRWYVFPYPEWKMKSVQTESFDPESFYMSPQSGQ